MLSICNSGGMGRAPGSIPGSRISLFRRYRVHSTIADSKRETTRTEPKSVPAFEPVDRLDGDVRSLVGKLFSGVYVGLGNRGVSLVAVTAAVAVKLTGSTDELGRAAVLAVIKSEDS